MLLSLCNCVVAAAGTNGLLRLAASTATAGRRGVGTIRPISGGGWLLASAAIPGSFGSTASPRGFLHRGWRGDACTGATKAYHFGAFRTLTAAATGRTTDTPDRRRAAVGNGDPNVVVPVQEEPAVVGTTMEPPKPTSTKHYMVQLGLQFANYWTYKFHLVEAETEEAATKVAMHYDPPCNDIVLLHDYGALLVDEKDVKVLGKYKYTLSAGDDFETDFEDIDIINVAEEPSVNTTESPPTSTKHYIVYLQFNCGEYETDKELLIEAETEEAARKVAVRLDSDWCVDIYDEYTLPVDEKDVKVLKKYYMRVWSAADVMECDSD